MTILNLVEADEAITELTEALDELRQVVKSLIKYHRIDEDAADWELGSFIREYIDNDDT
jgi:hypothetical protein